MRGEEPGKLGTDPFRLQSVAGTGDGPLPCLIPCRTNAAAQTDGLPIRGRPAGVGSDAKGPTHAKGVQGGWLGLVPSVGEPLLNTGEKQIRERIDFVFGEQGIDLQTNGLLGPVAVQKIAGD